MNREDKNEIIWRLRQETGRGLMDIEKGLDALIDALKRMPHKLDVAYDLKFEWKSYDPRKRYQERRERCKTCEYNSTKEFPCNNFTKREVQDYLNGKTNDCPEYYN